ncbi:hypothetical protein [Vulcanisaeta souniana]|nr:hypothetical protein [Vulcanisaeta souniana]
MTDRNVHVCGERTVRVMGSYDLENEDVNLLVSAITAAVSLAVLLLIFSSRAIITGFIS